jgi:hypothetical protein
MHTKRVRHVITKARIVRPSLRWLYHRGLDTSDIFVGSYPRAGSTWLRFLMHELLTGRESSFEAVNKSIPDIGRHYNAPRLLVDGGRLIKTHEPYQKEYGRAVYLVRDVRDVIISEYYFQQLWKLYDGTFQEFLDDFFRGQINRYGSWVNHTNSWLDAQELTPDQIFMIRFDELRQETNATLAKILTFLGSTANNLQIDQAIANNTTAKMRAKESSIKFTDSDQNFVRKGKIGGWKNFLTNEQYQKIIANAGPTLIRLGYMVETADAPDFTHKISSD